MSTPIWRTVHQIPSFGTYVMFRTDDNIQGETKPTDLYDGMRARIAQGPGGKFYLLLNGGKTQELSTLDPECRFFGPLNEEEFSIARDLVIGLTGHLPGK